MKKLLDLIEIFENNEVCVVLKVLPNAKDALIRLGYFTGKEDMIRLTKGGTQTCTIFYNDDSIFEWHWGRNSSTCVSDATAKTGRIIQDCIENDLDICMDGPCAAMNASLKIQSKKDALHATHIIRVMGEREDCVHKNGYYIRCESGMQNILNFFDKLGYKRIGDIRESISANGCPIKEFTIKR